MPSSSAAASPANSRAGLTSASAACESVPGTARSSRVTSATRAASTPGRSRASYTGPSAWSVQNRGMSRTRRMSLSQITRAIAELSSRWSTQSGTSSGAMRASSARNAPSSSRRRAASPASTSGSQPGGRSSRGMSSRVLGCWRARQAQNRSPSSSSSRMRRACRGRERLRNRSAPSYRAGWGMKPDENSAASGPVTHSYRSCNRTCLTCGAHRWERLPTYASPAWR